MNKFSLLLFSILMFCFGLILPVAAISQTAPERDYFSDSDTDPFEVSLYADTNYKNLIGTWKLSPGMRMLKIPEVTKEPKSIFMGSKAGAYLFLNFNFSSYTQMRQASNYQNIVYHLRRYLRYQNSTPLITGIPDGQSGGSDGVFGSPSVFSLIIHRKDIPDILGVYLISGENTRDGRGQFYSLPEAASDTISIYNKLPHGGPFLLEIVAGGSHQLGWSAKGASHPNANDIEITVDFSSGYSKKLPEKTSGPPPSSWNLSQFSKGPLASLKMRYAGPSIAPHYSQQQPHRHRAPPAKQPSSTPSVQAQTMPQRPTAFDPDGEFGHQPQSGIPPFGAHPQAESMLPPSHEAMRGPAGPEGWCCRSGEVFRDLLRPCEDTGGVLFLAPQEAHRHCQTQRGSPPPMAIPRGTVPPRHQPEGWCCRGGRVSEGLLQHCNEMRGRFFLNPEEAHHHCAAESGRLEDEGRGANHRGEGPDGERLEATPITLPGPRGVRRASPSPENDPAPMPRPVGSRGIEPSPEIELIPMPEPEFQGGVRPSPESLPLPLPDPRYPVPHMDPDPVLKPIPREYPPREVEIIRGQSIPTPEYRNIR